MNEPARFVAPPALFAQLRARRSQQRARRPERAPATKASLIETFKGLIDSLRPHVARVATSFVDGMDTLQREVEDPEDAFLLDPGMGR